MRDYWDRNEVQRDRDLGESLLSRRGLVLTVREPGWIHDAIVHNRSIVERKG